MDINECEMILKYFSTNLEQMNKAKNELAQSALNLYGPEAESDVKSNCNEQKFNEVGEKIKRLQSEFAEQQRLEHELQINYERYFSSTTVDLGESMSSSMSQSSPTKQSDISQENSVSSPASNGHVFARQGQVGADGFGDLYTEIRLLTEDEFAKVPSYMKNRATVDQINAIVLKFNAVLDKKYRILAAGINGATSRLAKDAYLKYKDQESTDTKGQRFCTEDDLRSSLAGREINHLKLVIPILRHCKRIRDTRSGKTTNLIVVPH